jgi:RNA polymerase sigma-70 factor (ECF subfamily)
MSVQPDLTKKNSNQSISDLSDQELWEKAGQGDAVAFSAIFKKYYTHLYQFAGRFVGDAQTAEHIVQDLFVTLWIQRDSIQIASNLKSYLYISVKNRSINYRKQNGFTYPDELNPPHSEELISTPEEHYLENEIHLAVHNAINKLPEKCRQIYLMKRYDNLKYQEIAEILNISVNTVKTQMKRALKSLHKHLAHLVAPLL